MAETTSAESVPRSANGRRETRLLLATIAISVTVLLVLARFRFPEEAARSAADVAPAPLERLAARATYDELAGIMADLERRIAPTIVVAAEQVNGTMSYAPAVRVLPDRSIAVLGRDRRLAAVGTAAAPNILSRDAVREIVVLQTPARPDAVVTTPTVPQRPGPRYLAIADATPQGPAVRPVYVGRTELFADPRWTDPVLAIAAVQQTLTRGAAVFSLDGGFVGLVSESGGTVIVVPANMLLAMAKAAPAAPRARGELPIEVQPLTTRLAQAAGVQRGVMISYVPPDVTELAPGDVIQSIDEIGVTTVAGFQQVEQSRTPGQPVRIEAVRRGQPVSAIVTAREAGTGGPTIDGIGAVLRNVPGAGVEVVTVHPGSAAGRADLRAGDLIVALEQNRRPQAAGIDRAFRAAASGESILLTVRRGTTHRIIALEK